ncbi:VOC family protein [Glaciimonas sp. CA11.2]|uniref:VOC family protein n=1 Tax=unclassified Glaciimonas TaxID=2644401 RepID=UPI002AB46050|nr:MULTISPECIES: VOC family protein [unclassified Glaciimonas]MDY7547731.1 VOC family protein [Glaciimonas sp. CA11.2]MEB0014390.1 VOC family protein [Glaciimonas sp. Cout2]MEB0082900.1 VOC family protein [Glaciimonas sp. Gout2]MEB0084348.1 VOC family protein [Glaciimonas sp. Gout2]MEB0163958.1 VOC family protein [Glaciimonas sp. CA11.2]
MIHFDHVCLAAQNVYEATFRLSRETGLGNYDGGFFPLYGLGHKVVPLSDDIYIEIESIVDHTILKKENSTAQFFEQQTMDGDCFIGWCLRADTMEEMEMFAAHHNTIVDANLTGKEAGRQMMNGSRGFSLQTPSAMTAWPMGKPNLYFKPGSPPPPHVASLPVEPGTGSAKGQGLLWIEIGETESAFAEWLGDVVRPSQFPFEIRYNGKSAGLYALGVKTTEGIKEIRRAPVKL